MSVESFCCPPSYLRSGGPVALPLAMLMLFLCASCGSTDVETRPPGYVEARVSLSQLKDADASQSWFELEPLKMETGGSRVSALLVTDSPHMPRLQVEVGGKWEALEATFTRGGTWVLIRSVAPSKDARLRVHRDDVEQMRSLLLAFAEPEPIDVQPQNKLSTRRQPLEGFLADLNVVSRETWGARATGCSSQNPTKDKIAIHHTVTAVTRNGTYEGAVAGVQAFHMDGRGWCDVGYHFLVTLDGQVWEGRPINLLGSHVGSHNTNNIGVSFVGCFHPTADCDPFPPQEPPQAMVDGVKPFLAGLVNHYQIEVTEQSLKGHRDHSGSSTACPGDNLYAHLPEFREAASGIAQTTGTVRGVVWDTSVTETPSDPNALRLPGATVTCSCGQAATAAADGAGWAFEVEPGTWTISASLDGYQTASREVTVTTVGETVWSSIGLEPMAEVETVSVSVQVSSEADGNPVDGATLTLGDLSAVSNADGATTFDAPVGSYALHVTHPDFLPYSDNVEVSAANSELSVALRPVDNPDEPDAGGTPDPGADTDVGNSEPDTGVSGADAGVDGQKSAATTVNEGCGCSVPGRRPGTPWGLVLFALLVIGVGIRRL